MKLLLLLLTAVALAAAEDKPIKDKNEEEKLENVDEEKKSNKTEKRGLFGLGVYDGGNYVDGNQGYYPRGSALDLLGGAQYSGAGQVALGKLSLGYNLGHVRGDQGVSKKYALVIPVPVPVTRPYPVPVKSQGVPYILYVPSNTARGHSSSSGLYTGGYTGPIAPAAHPGVGYYYSTGGSPAYTHYGANPISNHNSPSTNYEGHGKAVTILQAIRPNVGYSNAPSGGSDSHYGYYRSHYARSAPPPSESSSQNSIGGYSSSTGNEGRNYVYDRPVYSHGSGASEYYSQNSVTGSSSPNDVAYTTPGKNAGVQYEYVDPSYLSSLAGSSTPNNVGYNLETNQGYVDPSYGSSVPSNQNSEAYTAPTANSGIAQGYVDSSYLGSAAGSGGQSSAGYNSPSGNSVYSNSNYLRPSAGSSSQATAGYSSPGSSSGSPYDQSAVNYAEQTQVYISPNVRYAGPGSYIQFGQKYSADDYTASRGSAGYKVSEKEPSKASDTKSNAAYNEYDSSRYSGSSGSSSAGHEGHSNAGGQNSAAYQTYLIPGYSSGILSGSEKGQSEAYTTDYSSNYNNPSADYSRSEEQQSSSAYSSPSENHSYANSRG